MPNSRLLKTLASNLPAHRRTERDWPVSPKLLARQSAARMQAKPVKGVVHCIKKYQDRGQ